MKNLILFIFTLFWGLNFLNAQWTFEELFQARWYHTSVAVNGKVIFAGGMIAGFATVSTVDIYDVETGSWSTAELSAPRAFIAATVNGNKAYFAGGGGLFSGQESDVIDVYDSETGNWSTMQLSTPKNVMAAASVGTKVIFAGGGSYNFPTLTPSDVIEIYDVETGQWEYRQLSEGRGIMGVAVADGKVYFGGGTANGSVTDVVDIFDVENDTVTTLNLSQARAYSSAVAVGEKVIFAGGYGFPLDEFGEIDCFNTTQGTWESVAYLSEAKGLMAAAVLGSKAYFAGGSSVQSNGNVETPYNKVNIYNSETGLWTEDYLTVERTGASAVVWENQLFISGGFNWDEGHLSSVEIFTDTALVTSSSSHIVSPDFQLKISPNPADDLLRVQLPNSGTFQLSILDLQGKQMLRRVDVSGPSAEIPVHGLASGKYLLRIENETYSTTVKFIHME